MIYDFKCRNCGELLALEMSQKEYQDLPENPECPGCCAIMFRRITPVMTAVEGIRKGQYNSSNVD